MRPSAAGRLAVGSRRTCTRTRRNGAFTSPCASDKEPFVRERKEGGENQKRAKCGMGKCGADQIWHQYHCKIWYKIPRSQEEAWTVNGGCYFQWAFGWLQLQLSTLRRIIRRKSSVKNFKSSTNPASPFPNKNTVENDASPFPHVQYTHLQITFMMTVKNGASEGAASLSFTKCVQWDLRVALRRPWHEPLDQRTSAFCSGLRTVYCLGPCLEKAHIQRKSSVTFFKSSANPASTTQKSTAK